MEQELSPKDIVDIISGLRNEINTNPSMISDSTLREIQFYKEFEISPQDAENGINGLLEKDVLIAKFIEKQPNGNAKTYYELFDYVKGQDGKEAEYSLIAIMQQDGKLEFTSEYIAKFCQDEKFPPEVILKMLGLDRELYLDKYLDEDNLERFEVGTQKPKNMGKEKLGKEKNFYKNRPEKIEDKSLIEQDLQEQEDKTLNIQPGSISHVVDVLDPQMYEDEMIPGIREYDQPVKFCKNETTGQWMLIGRKEGKFEPLANIEPSEHSMQDKYELGEEGTNIQKSTTYQTMKITNKRQGLESSIAVDLDDYGYPKFQYVREDTNQREHGESTGISRPIETNEVYPIAKAVEKTTDRDNNPRMHGEMKELQQGEAHNVACIADNPNTIREEGAIEGIVYSHHDHGFPGEDNHDREERRAPNAH